MPEFTVRVENLGKLNRSFRRVSTDLSLTLRDDLKRIADPVRSEAESRVRSDIRKIGPVWSRMKVGATQTYVYIAPATRRRRGSRSRRPNLGTLLYRSMAAAAASKRATVVRGLEADLDRLFKREGF